MGYQLSEIERLLCNLIRIGTIAEVDHDPPRARVKIGANLTAPLPWIAHRAGEDRAWWPLTVGEQVVVLSPSGNMTQGVILGALYSTAAPAPSSTPGVDRRKYSDGAVVEYDSNTHTLTADIPGDVAVTATGDISADAVGDIDASAGGDASISAEGNLTGSAGVDAAISAGGNLTGSAGTAITLAAPSIVLAADLIRVAGPLTAGGLNGEAYAMTFRGDITHLDGDYTNDDGDVVAQGISLVGHTHAEYDAAGQTSAPN